MPTDAEVAGHYSSLYAEDHDQRSIQESAREYYRSHCEDLVRHTGGRSDLCLLDYGSAWPTLLEEAEHVEGITRRIGIEHDPAARAHGIAQNIEMYAPHDMLKHIQAGSVDIIRFSHVIEHLIDPVAELKKIMPLIAENGVVYVTQPMFPILKIDARPTQILDAVFPEHLHFFNAASVLRLLAPYQITPREVYAFSKSDLVEDVFDGMVDLPAARKLAQPLQKADAKHVEDVNVYPFYFGQNLHYIGYKQSSGTRTKRAVKRQLRRVKDILEKGIPTRKPRNAGQTITMPDMNANEHIELLDLGNMRIYVDPREHIVRYLRETPQFHEGDETLNLLIDKLIERTNRVAYLEIGCNFGVELVPAAKRIQAACTDFHIGAFDPGEASRLVPRTLVENNIQDIVNFYPIAVSNSMEPVTFYMQPGHSEDNRMVNPHETATIRKVVDAITVDEYATRNNLNHELILAKIDTQGGEPEVLAGVRKTRNRMAAIMEYTPWAIASRRKPEDFLRELAETHQLVDLGASRDAIKFVGDDFVSFTKDVDERGPKWTDLLLLPHSAPDYAKAVLDALFD